MVHLMGNSLWQLVAQSDTISKLVLIILLIMSILCWSVFIYKLLLMRMKKRQMQEALVYLKSVTTLDQLMAAAAHFSGTMPGYFLSKNLASLKNFLEVNKERGQTTLSEQQWLLLQQSIGQSVDDMLVYEESYLPILTTSFTISTLLGLFGTVWGLVHAFIRISEKQSADIVTVAPGIAEALITTLAGLVVAIPAIVLFNYLMVKMRSLENQLLMLGDRVSIIIQKLFVR
ncbi:MAG: MotA/TolQ/ExbB proton channel family protein [Candidatus Babeliales bacterium]